MTTDILTTLKQIDPLLLTHHVRKQQRSPSFEILDWTVQPLSHETIISTTGGLFRFSGTGQDGLETKSWSLILKIINNPQNRCQEPTDWCYWKREMLAYESGVLTNLPDDVRAPRCYAVTEHEGVGWVWMEDIVEATERRWSLEHYRRAAHHMGRFGGDFLLGTPLPKQLWFTDFFRNIHADNGLSAILMNPESPENAWQHPLVQQAFGEPLRSGILRIWEDKHRFFNALAQLPQVLCHNDLHRRNLMFSTGTDGKEALIVLDWAFCGIGAVGADMGELIAGSMYFHESDVLQAAELEKAVMEAYLAGLRDAGWSGDPQLARLGYLLSAVLWYATTLPIWTMWMLDEEEGVDTLAMYGHPSEKVLAGWVTLTEFLLERADEARSLIRILGLE